MYKLRISLDALMELFNELGIDEDARLVIGCEQMQNMTYYFDSPDDDPKLKSLVQRWSNQTQRHEFTGNFSGGRSSVLLEIDQDNSTVYVGEFPYLNVPRGLDTERNELERLLANNDPRRVRHFRGYYWWSLMVRVAGEDYVVDQLSDFDALTYQKALTEARLMNRGSDD